MPLSYEQWLSQWTAHLSDDPAGSAVPPSASRIHIPLIIVLSDIKIYLSVYTAHYDIYVVCR